MLYKIIFALFLIISPINSYQLCPDYSEEIHFIGNPEDIESISNCSYLNSSLFITGDYNILDLQGLQNLEVIDGYLVKTLLHRVIIILFLEMKIMNNLNKLI